MCEEPRPIGGFDNRFFPHMARSPRHLAFTMGGKRILYAYIRKNGCSSFKAAISGDPDIRFSELRSSYPASRLTRYDARIFVWRDPEERLVSLYRNKVLDAPHADDLVRRYRQVMDEAPSSFDKFALFATTNADPHVWPQRLSLFHMRYTHAIALPQLHEVMTDLVGAEAAEGFRVPRNSSAKTPVKVSPFARALIHRHYRCDFDMIARIHMSTRPR